MRKVMYADEIKEATPGASVTIPNLIGQEIAVASVNSVNPDSSKNVILTQDDIGGGSTYVQTHNDFTTTYKNNVDKAVPLTNQTYAGEINLSTNYEVYYNSYSTNVAETPTISATPLVGAVARLYFVTGASGSLVATNLGTLRAGSDTYTISKINEILVFSLPEGLEYSIKVLN